MFGEALWAHRRASGLTQAELAERAQLSERAISDLERGLKTPQRATVQMLVDALQLSSRDAEDLAAAARSQAPRRVDGPAAQNLPIPLTSFVGREDEITRLVAQLTARRLLTLI